MRRSIPRRARTRSAARRSPRQAPRRARGGGECAGADDAARSGRSMDRRESARGRRAGRRRRPARSACARCHIEPPPARVGVRAEQDRLGRGLRHAHDDRAALVVQQPMQHPVAVAQHPVGAPVQRQAKRPGRPDLLAQLDPPRRSHRRGARARAVRAPVRPSRSPPPSRWMSTSSERVETICSASHACPGRSA